MISCIYTITNKVNNKIYIGKTNNFISRKNHHKCDLRKGTHINFYLQSAWNKYGEDNFVFEIIEEYEIDHLCAMEHYWANLLDVFNYNKGYNTKPTHPYCKGGNSKEAIDKTRVALLGRKHSVESIDKMSKIKLGKVMPEETKRKISESNKGKIISEETRKKLSIHRYNNPLTPFKGQKRPHDLMMKIGETRKKPIAQYTLDMIFIKEWKSAIDAKNELNINKGNIASCCKGIRNNAGGYIWKYR